MLVESSKLHDPEVWNLGTWNLELGTWNLEPTLRIDCKSDYKSSNTSKNK